MMLKIVVPQVFWLLRSEVPVPRVHVVRPRPRRLPGRLARWWCPMLSLCSCQVKPAHMSGCDSSIANAASITILPDTHLLAGIQPESKLLDGRSAVFLNHTANAKASAAAQAAAKREHEELVIRHGGHIIAFAEQVHVLPSYVGVNGK